MSLQLIKNKIDDCKNSGNQKGEAEALIEAANIHLSEGEPADALSVSKDARVLFRKLGDFKSEAGAIQLLVAALSASDELEEATREAYDALNVAKQSGDPATVAGALALVVSTHYQSLSKEPDTDSDSFKEGVKELTGTADEAVKAFRKLKDSQGQASALLGMARVYMLADEPDKAKFVADMAYMLYTQAKDGNGYFDACMCLSLAHIQRGDFASAMRYANEARDLCMNFQDVSGMTDASELISQIKECTKLRSEKLQFKADAVTMQKLYFK
jgi:tetratricopeptide (TPR) repeat protein